MSNIENIMEAKKENMLLKYPQQKELTIDIFKLVLEMFQEDFDAIAQKNKRLKIVFNCISSIFEIEREHNVKKQYAIDLLDIFLDSNIMLYLTRKLEKYGEDYIFAIRAVRSEFYSSQWSDNSSEHWQRAINRLKKIK